MSLVLRSDEEAHLPDARTTRRIEIRPNGAEPTSWAPPRVPVEPRATEAAVRRPRHATMAR